MRKFLLLSAVGALSAAVSIPAADATVLAVIGQDSDTDQVTAIAAGRDYNHDRHVGRHHRDRSRLFRPVRSHLAFTATSVGPANDWG